MFRGIDTASKGILQKLYSGRNYISTYYNSRKTSYRVSVYSRAIEFSLSIAPRNDIYPTPIATKLETRESIAERRRGIKERGSKFKAGYAGGLGCLEIKTDGELPFPYSRLSTACSCIIRQTVTITASGESVGTVSTNSNVIPSGSSDSEADLSSASDLSSEDSGMDLGDTLVASAVGSIAVIPDRRAVSASSTGVGRVLAPASGTAASMIGDIGFSAGIRRGFISAPGAGTRAGADNVAFVAGKGAILAVGAAIGGVGKGAVLASSANSAGGGLASATGANTRTNTATSAASNVAFAAGKGAVLASSASSAGGGLASATGANTRTNTATNAASNVAFAAGKGAVLASSASSAGGGLASATGANTRTNTATSAVSNVAFAAGKGAVLASSASSAGGGLASATGTNTHISISIVDSLTYAADIEVEPASTANTEGTLISDTSTCTGGNIVFTPGLGAVLAMGTGSAGGGLASATVTSSGTATSAVSSTAFDKEYRSVPASSADSIREGTALAIGTSTSTATSMVGSISFASDIEVVFALSASIGGKSVTDTSTCTGGSITFDPGLGAVLAMGTGSAGGGLASATVTSSGTTTSAVSSTAFDKEYRAVPASSAVIDEDSPSTIGTSIAIGLRGVSAADTDPSTMASPSSLSTFSPVQVAPILLSDILPSRSATISTPAISLSSYATTGPTPYTKLSTSSAVPSADHNPIMVGTNETCYTYVAHVSPFLVTAIISEPAGSTHELCFAACSGFKLVGLTGGSCLCANSLVNLP
jgi:hypothetical protein